MQSAINFCSVSGDTSFSTFDSATGDYELTTQDAVKYPPGVYTLYIYFTYLYLDLNGENAELFDFRQFELTLAYPPFYLLANPFNDLSQEIGSPSH